MDERRRSPRNKVTIDVNGKGKSTLEVRVVDLSEHGVLVESSSAVRPGGMCELAIEAPGGERKIRAEVRRCRAQMVEGEKGPKIVYQAGLEFEEPAAGGEEIRALISELCGIEVRAEEDGEKDEEPESLEGEDKDTGFKFAM